MKREEKEISPYLLPTGYIMESCPKPWKCQERKGRSEGEKEDGQRKLREKRGRWRKGEDVRICPLEDMRVLLEHMEIGLVFFSLSSCFAPTAVVNDSRLRFAYPKGEGL